ncbi:hypothetical protein C2G38_2035440 [Gigaspora rosea]|uniref:Aspartic peptidase DDI1-type domain-containing protein n=1 Tax=Gigaspora rosea TaxID=44941 RepID=A0A397VEF9_9GLOM|nr:hypothetical protein C2G38_2035440 [Gigaspora rosea]
MARITRPGRVTMAKIAKFCLKQDEHVKTKSMYCKTQVKGHPILLILDSGSLECVVSVNFLKEVGISINRPSTIMIVGVHREQKHPLGEVDEVPITMGGTTITSHAIVTQAGIIP